MKTHWFLPVGLGLAAALALTPRALAQSTAFTYQGQLKHAGNAANGVYELYFTLFDAPTNGQMVGSTVAVAPLPITNGLFTTTLDFGAAAFTGADRWLEIAATVFGTDQPVVTLVPRQPITPTPYALHAANAAGLMSFVNAPLDIKVNSQRVLRLENNLGDTPNLIGGASVNGVAPGIIGATIGGGGTSSPGFEATNRVESNYGVVAGGGANTIQDLSGNSTISGGWLNTIGQQSGWSTIGGGESNTVEPYARYSTIGGGGLNHTGGYGSVIAGGSINTVQIEAEHSTIGGGLRNLIASNSVCSTIGGGTGNANHSGGWGTIGGGEGNQVEAHIPGKDFVTTAYGMSEHVTVGGGRLNRASGRGATIAGGEENVVRGAGGTIGGGYGNTVSLGVDILPFAFTHTGSTIAGGENSLIANSQCGTIAGGADNHIADGVSVTISGGLGNVAGGFGATVGGGYYNDAHGQFANVTGGTDNQAAGDYSLASGRGAKAIHPGAFVWADSSELSFNSVAFASAATNEFAVRATGGVRLVSAIDTNGTDIGGVTLSPGSGAWASLSDRQAKENFVSANARQILGKVAALPLSSWNYKAQGTDIRHLGPTAQDFHSAFGLGESDRTITTVDADGVALAAIQGLNQKLTEELQRKDQEIAELKLRLERLERLLTPTGSGGR